MACRKLAPRELAVFSILLAGGSYQEASAALGMSVPACRAAMASAKKKLQRGLWRMLQGKGDTMTASNQPMTIPSSDLFAESQEPYDELDDEQLLLLLAALGVRQVARRLQTDFRITPEVIATALAEEAARILLSCGDNGDLSEL
jgi:hypothetical protein